MTTLLWNTILRKLGMVKIESSGPTTSTKHQDYHSHTSNASPDMSRAGNPAIPVIPIGSHFHFLSLPLEIRDVIYAFLDNEVAVHYNMVKQIETVIQRSDYHCLRYTCGQFLDELPHRNVNITVHISYCTTFRNLLDYKRIVRERITVLTIDHPISSNSYFLKFLGVDEANEVGKEVRDLLPNVRRLSTTQFYSSGGDARHTPDTETSLYELMSLVAAYHPLLSDVNMFRDWTSGRMVVEAVAH